jgi:hypothetical protein
VNTNGRRSGASLDLASVDWIFALSTVLYVDQVDLLCDYVSWGAPKRNTDDNNTTHISSKSAVHSVVLRP